MKGMLLVNFCIAENGEIILGRQAEAARLLGVTPHAIKKMLLARRNITLFFDDEGKYIDHEEKTRVGRRKAADAA